MGRLPRDPPAWVADYIGLPWRERGRDRAGVDCWGLVRLVLAERFGIAVPSYDGRYTDLADRAELGALVRGETGPWAEIASPSSLPGPTRQSPAAAPGGPRVKPGDDENMVRAGDVVLLRIGGEPCHCGVLVARVLMLHVERGTCAALERLDGIRWGKRVAGFYRWTEAG